MIKTVTLETAKALKEAGFKQDTGFSWVFHKPTNTWNTLQFCSDIDKNIAAPTSDEILEELPLFLDQRFLTVRKLKDYYSISYMFNEGYTEYFDHEFLCEALSIMWLYLKKEGLL